MITQLCYSQEQISNKGFGNWHNEGLGEDPDNYGSFYNQFFGLPRYVTKTTDAHSQKYVLKIISDTATVYPPFGDGVNRVYVGVTVWKGNLVNGTVNLDLSGFENGLYFICTENKAYKLIKQ
ncbi:MAG: hypothetical protein J5I91_01915 [Bacteroidetes bacterium]|nr:hypothetical protein [Bacteroidota bacterium]